MGIIEINDMVKVLNGYGDVYLFINFFGLNYVIVWYILKNDNRLRKLIS